MSDVYYDIKDGSDDFDAVDPTEDDLFDLADVTDIRNELSDKFIQNGQSEK